MGSIILEVGMVSDNVFSVHPVQDFVYAVDESPDPAASLSAMIVFLLSRLESLDAVKASDAIRQGLLMHQNGAKVVDC